VAAVPSRLHLILLFCLCLLPASCAQLPSDNPLPLVRLGSKTFTESIILADMAADLVRQTGARVEHRPALGGTRILWDALVSGAIDLYPEYTGTITKEILADQGIASDTALRRVLADYGLKMTGPLGFHNNYAIGLRRETCRTLGLARISDLRRFPQLRFGFSNEFMHRADGWPGLRERYRLPQTQVQGLDHDLALRALAAGALDATELYTTDADIATYDFCILADDLHFFTQYAAVFLYRQELAAHLPRVADTLSKLEGLISEADMMQMNLRVKRDKIPESVVAARFLAEKHLGLTAAAGPETLWSQIWQRTREHLTLVLISLSAAILLAIPLGILAAKRPRLGQVILSCTGIIQTIPSLALLVFMIPILGIGAPPVIVALFLYSLLPIVRNTCTGLCSLPPEILDSARALGLSPGARLRLIELPLASREILAGIKTSAVINVGTATLGALIGAGGYGQPILTGIRLNDLGLILQGAVPAALLALLVQALFDAAERFFVPKGLRLKPST
jgi:osmoprotectant transport system substrate-binding protein/osmoprotectant transport system permease protein